MWTTRHESKPFIVIPILDITRCSRALRSAPVVPCSLIPVLTSEVNRSSVHPAMLFDALWERILICWYAAISSCAKRIKTLHCEKTTELCLSSIEKISWERRPIGLYVNQNERSLRNETQSRRTPTE